MSFKDFFRGACGYGAFPFQIRFHESEADFRVLEVPTGLGKTQTVIAEWLYREPTTRLVYCLPGRALTRQVAKVAREMVERAGRNKDIKVVELMGGSEDLDLTLGPHERAILVGTQDILVSRALNRGYAQSPFRWPMDFGLVNNDAMWVFDEVQLLGEAVATSSQLAEFRKQMGTFGRVPSVWMSATFERSWLNTVDFHEHVDVIGLQDSDKQDEIVRQRLHATKRVQETNECNTPRECAEFVKNQHRDGTLTIVISNTVGRAQEIWDELRKAGFNDAVLLHSRFRPCEREGIVKQAIAATAGIIVSTQVIEAGVDIDADLMITDVAPWASLVQRFGRVNRRGEKDGCRIYWVRSPQRQRGKTKTDGTEFLPYEVSDVRQAIAVLETVQSASPADLTGKIRLPAPYRFVLRRSDLLDLFDTTPDLTGNQIDVSRFVRSGEETSVYVAWRSWPEKEAPTKKRFVQDELCPVPHFPGGNLELKALLKKQPAWTWSYAKRGKWEKVDPDRIYAGMRILLRSEVGGYDAGRGWAPESKDFVKPFEKLPDEPENSMDSDLLSEPKSGTQTLEEHTDEVVAELQRVIHELKLVDLNGTRSLLEQAARYHDWGKAHPVFQQTLHNLEEPPETAPQVLLAKQERKLSRRRHSRDWFRHELASALALLAQGSEFLEVYLAAAHHGKVRLNIRSMPGEVMLRNPDARIARGIEAGDKLFAADLGSDIKVAETKLDLTVTELGVKDGCAGWSDRVLDLLEEYGPFQLAYLEMLLRVSDETASRKAAKGAK